MSNVVAMPDRHSTRGYVAAEVRAELARARITGNQLAKLLGQSQAYWSRRLSGRVALNVDDLEVLAGLLNVPVGQFFAGTRNPHPAGPNGGGTLPRLDSNQQPSD